LGSQKGLKKVAEDIRHRQDHIEFLENYIKELTDKIDEITDGRDFPKRIQSLEYRIATLKKSENKTFKSRIAELETDLKDLKAEFAKLKPILDELESERTFYRQIQGEL
jgi:chromosome segregation ATPase